MSVGKDVRKSINLYDLHKYNIFSQAQPKQKNLGLLQDVHNKQSYLPMHMAYIKKFARKKVNIFLVSLKLLSKTICWSEAVSRVLRSTKGVFRAQLNIYDAVFMQK